MSNGIIIDTVSSPVKIGFEKNFNIAVPFIDRHLEEGRGNKLAIIGSYENITYARLVEKINRTGNMLINLGLSRGARVLMVIQDSPEFYFLFWGAIKAGFVPVPLNTLLKADDYNYMIQDSGCEALFYSTIFAAEVEKSLEGNDINLKHVYQSDEYSGLDSLISTCSKDLKAAPASASDDCFWLYSSGSTGRPKGTVHSHADIPVTAIRYAVGVLGMTERDVCFSAAKLFFAYGLGNAMTFPLWVGGTSILDTRAPSPNVTFEVIERHKPTIYFGVPTLYAAQLRALEEVSVDFSSLRVCISAGEALPGDLFRRWRNNTGLLILDGIGSTEILHIFISNFIDDYKPGVSGRLVPGYEARILDECGNEVSSGESGELMIKGDSIAKYYWNNEEKTKSTMQGDWINTGDTYYQDEEGYFVYCGRNDDMMKVGGIWCSPFEIEARLIEHPKVLEAAVVARADADNLIKPEAYIVLNEVNTEESELTKELAEHCKDGLARYKFPRWFNFVKELPKTATGKIQRFKLRH